MHVALVSFCSPRDRKAQAILKKLMAASESRGNRVDFVDGNDLSSGVRLTPFDYVAVVVKSPSGLSAKIPDRVRECLASSGTITGKKGCALVIKAGFRAQGACARLMDALESEGVKIDYFDVVRSADHATWVGSKIG